MLRVEALDLHHGDAQALDGVTLDVPERAIVAIVGANGAGKTSLIRAVAGHARGPRAGASSSGVPTSRAGPAIARAIWASAGLPKAGRFSPA
jgi:ABC-type branched-subunit amino acid transport system ATPase component